MVLVKSVEVDLSVKGGEAAKAKISEIDAKAEQLKRTFGDGFALKIDKAAASEKLRVFRTELAEATRDRTANVKVKVDDSALARLGKKMQGAGGPGWLGPALLLAPAAATLGGVGAAAGAGLAGAFAAGAGALAAFGAVAKPVLTGAKTAADAVSKAQEANAASVAKVTAQYQYSMSVAKTKAQQQAAYATEQKGFNSAEIAQNAAVAKAYANMGPAQIALSKQLGQMADAWSAVKNAQTPVIAGALQPWLKAVTDLTKQLGPIIKAVAPVIGSLGSQFESLVSSQAFTKFRDFIASTGSRVVGGAGNAVLGLVQAFIILLPKFNPLIQGAATWLGNLGPAIEKWASSKKTADDITKFMKWFHDNGPVVVGLLKNLGGALKAMAPGLTAGGALELKVISDFLGWVAKLPPAIAKPLFEVAGALLLLNKLGVVSVGLKLLGMDAAAAAAGGGAAGLWGKLLPGVRLAGGALVAIVAVDMILKNTSSGPGGKNWLDNPFGADPKSKDTAKQGLSTWAGLGNQIVQIWDKTWNNTITRTAKGFHDIAGWFDTGRHWIAARVQLTGHDIANWWNITWNNTITRTAKGFHDIAGWFDTGRHWIASKWDLIRHDAAAAWDTIWNNTVGRVIRGVSSVVSWVGTLPGRITGALGKAGNVLSGWGSGVISGLLAGMTSIIGSVWNFIKGIPGKILAFLGIKSPPQWAIDAGKHIMNGIGIGMAQAQTASQRAAVKFANATAAAVAGSGVQRWAPMVSRALAMEALPANLLQDVLYQMQTESGGNPRAINLTDINAQLGHAVQGPDAGHRADVRVLALARHVLGHLRSPGEHRRGDQLRRARQGIRVRSRPGRVRARVRVRHPVGGAGVGVGRGTRPGTGPVPRRGAGRPRLRRPRGRQHVRHQRARLPPRPARGHRPGSRRRHPRTRETRR